MNEITKKISLFIFTFSSVFLFCFNSAFASTTYHYTCSGWIYGSDRISCSSGVWITNMTGYNWSIDAFDNNSDTPFLSAGTWYINAKITDVGRVCDNDDVCYDFGTARFSDNSGGNFAYLTSLSETDIPFISVGSGYLQWHGIGILKGGSISDICITDTIGGCSPPAPPAPATSGILFGRHYAGSGSDGMATTAGSLLASVGAVSDKTFASTFPYLMLSAGVFIAFYIIQAIVITLGGKISKEKTSRSWSGEGVMEHEYRGWRKKARSRRKRGLDIE